MRVQIDALEPNNPDRCMNNILTLWAPARAKNLLSNFAYILLPQTDHISVEFVIIFPRRLGLQASNKLSLLFLSLIG